MPPGRGEGGGRGLPGRSTAPRRAAPDSASARAPSPAGGRGRGRWAGRRRGCCLRDEKFAGRAADAPRMSGPAEHCPAAWTSAAAGDAEKEVSGDGTWQSGGDGLEALPVERVRIVEPLL